MARLVSSDAPKPRLQVEEPTSPRLTPDVIERGLGAERVGEAPRAASPLTAWAIRQELHRRLRSTGGRPGLEGADIKPKIPMRRVRWEELERLAALAGTDDFRPSPAQVASVILDLGIVQFTEALSRDEGVAARLMQSRKVAADESAG